MEDGEIPDNDSGDINITSHTATPRLRSVLGTTYDRSHEWPGEPSNTSANTNDLSYTYSNAKVASSILSSAQPSFRLIVVDTSILLSKHKLAILDGYSQVQFGRDVADPGTDTPRIRLKEMEVSKVHATAYWDMERREWGVVDMGSKHGTFVDSTSASGAGRVGHGAGVRLSPPRVASVPHRLRHMDRITIGSTTFVVHIHDDHIPCEDCSPIGGDEIPLFPAQKGKGQHTDLTLKRSRDAAGLDLDTSVYATQTARDPKKALTLLKRSLLIRHSDDPGVRSPSPGDARGRYVDRSARRRALHPASHPDAPGVSPQSTRSNSPSVPPPVETVTSQPPAPLPTTNVGHRLLMKQGWEPGTSLGVSQDLTVGRIGLVEPLEVSSSLNRTGLGMANSVLLPNANGAQWKEGAKHKRWDSLRLEAADRRT
jgi:hypothetical protein